MVKNGATETVSGKMANAIQVPGPHGQPGVVAVSPVGRAIPQELVPARLVPVRDQVQIIEDASKGIVQ